MIIPIEVIQSGILPFLQTEDLFQWKATNKYFYEQLPMHSRNLKCSRCGSHRFSYTSRKELCYVKNCKSTDLLHPIIKYYSNRCLPVCSFGCLI